jgi:hypothetical protein
MIWAVVGAAGVAGWGSGDWAGSYCECFFFPDLELCCAGGGGKEGK